VARAPPPPPRRHGVRRDRMPSRGLMVLAVVTALSVAAAAVAEYRRAAATAAGADGALLLPALMQRINEVAAIRVERGAETLNLVREDGRWSLAEKGGYAARFEAVKTTLVALARLETIEAKTAKPALYPKLQVEDPGSAEANSTRLTLRDAGGATLGAIIVGKTRDGAAGEGRAGVYVRRPDEARAWLADGDPRLPDDAVDWLERDLIDVARERIASARLEPPEGDVVAVSRADASQQNFTLAGVPEGRKIKSAGSVNAVAWTLERLRFDDVRPAAEVDFAAAGSATFASFDGLTVRVLLADKDDAAWARLEAAAAAGAAPEIGEEAAAIRARTDGWAYRLPDHQVEKLRTPLADLIEPKPE